MRELSLAVILFIAGIPSHDLVRAAKPQGFTGIVDLTASQWFLTTQGNGGKNGTLNNNPLTGGLTFNFFQSVDDPTGAYDNYLVTSIDPKGRKTATLSGVMTAVFRIATTGVPVFGFHSGGSGAVPAHMHFFISSGPWDGPDGTRWWSYPLDPIDYPLQDTAVPLPANIGAYGVFNNPDGTVTMAVSVTDPSYWNGVFGEHATDSPTTLAQFQQVLNNANYIGVCFGGGDAACHGANVNGGTASFELKELTIR